jgi:thioredoxin 1
MRFFLGKLLIICLFALGIFGLLLLQTGGAEADPAPAKSRPALYEFGAKTCLPCIQMQKVMAELKTSHGEQVEFRMVYADEELELFKEYKIVVIPTQVFFNAGGQEVERHIGALTKEEVLKKLKDLKFIN